MVVFIAQKAENIALTSGSKQHLAQCADFVYYLVEHPIAVNTCLAFNHIQVVVLCVDNIKLVVVQRSLAGNMYSYCDVVGVNLMFYKVISVFLEPSACYVINLLFGQFVLCLRDEPQVCKQFVEVLYFRMIGVSVIYNLIDKEKLTFASIMLAK